MQTLSSSTWGDEGKSYRYVETALPGDKAGRIYAKARCAPSVRPRERCTPYRYRKPISAGKVQPTRNELSANTDASASTGHPSQSVEGCT